MFACEAGKKTPANSSYSKEFYENFL